MSHNHTQPEEIDHILMAMAGLEDVEDDMKIQMGAPSSGAVRDVDRDKFRTGFSCVEIECDHTP